MFFELTNEIFYLKFSQRFPEDFHKFFSIYAEDLEVPYRPKVKTVWSRCSMKLLSMFRYLFFVTTSPPSMQIDNRKEEEENNLSFSFALLSWRVILRSSSLLTLMPKEKLNHFFSMLIKHWFKGKTGGRQIQRWVKENVIIVVFLTYFRVVTFVLSAICSLNRSTNLKENERISPWFIRFIPLIST